MIRTQELLAARRIDGGEQFFTRAYDFGFSKNPEETFTKWSHDSILSDMVWVIRNFRPDIIITRFATDGSGGHGHHTASAMLAEEAFDAAADPTRFPEQLQYVSVWKTRRMFWNVSTRFANPNADMSPYIKLDVGGYNPLLGKSYGEIAAESRSMHKSQGFGSAKQRGESLEFFKPLKGDTTGLKDIFEGIDFSWKRVKGGERMGKEISKIMKEFKVEEPHLINNKLHFLHEEVFMDVYELQTNYQEKNLLQEKDFDINKILVKIYGIYSEISALQPNNSFGEKVSFKFEAINRSNKIIDTISIFRLKKIRFDNHLTKYEDTLFIGNLYDGSPKWIINGIKQNLFVKNDRSPFYRRYDNLPIVNYYQKKNRFYEFLNYQYKWVDPEKGELYRPLVITPPVMINLTQKSFVFTDEKPKEIQVIVKAGKDNIQTKVKANLPLGWTTEPVFASINLPKKGDEKIVTFSIKPPITTVTSSLVEKRSSVVEKPVISSEVEKQSTINFTAEIDGIEYTKGIKEIKYDHIPVQTWFPEAEAKLVKVDVKKTFNTVGYIQGAGDEVPASLEQIGYKVVMITDEQLQNGNLNEFPAIVLGVRAFNTNEKLQQYKQRVFDYVKEGGNLIVQYNTNSFFGPLKDQISPVPFKLSRDRVTIEEAPVTFLLPAHPVLNFPNKITNADFDGWIQERGIYFGTDMDSSFLCPLSMNDPGEKPNKGSLIIAKYGKGNYVYTGLAFFRELPAGVPGAYRLFANILSLEKRK
jgi:hypothetical protein